MRNILRGNPTAAIIAVGTNPSAVEVEELSPPPPPVSSKMDPIDAMARIMDVANNMGDGKSMGYDVVAGVTVLVPPPFFTVVVGDDDDNGDIVPTDTAFTPTSPSSFFAKRCEDGSGGNPPSLFIDASLPLVSSS